MALQALVSDYGKGMRTVMKKNEERKRQDIVSESYLQTVKRRFMHHHLAVVSLVIVALLGGAALLAPVIAPYKPDDIVGPFSGMCSAGCYMPCGFPFWWESWRH